MLICVEAAHITSESVRKRVPLDNAALGMIFPATLTGNDRDNFNKIRGYLKQYPTVVLFYDSGSTIATDIKNMVARLTVTPLSPAARTTITSLEEYLKITAVDGRVETCYN
ncbi:MAG: hypothetical protein SGI73_13930 [Chloroflexota bacterium]|nr:hypothetical protein [Chloroflexota bacterium]